MSKITLNSVGSLINTTTAQTSINNDFATVQTAFDNTLSRDGTSPNQMGANLDMGSNQIINLPSPISVNSPVRLGDINTLNGGGTIQALPAGGTTGQLLSKTSNTDYQVSWTSANSLTSGTNINITGSSPYVVNTVTNPTFTSATLSTPVLSGTVTGTYTLGGTPSISGSTVNSGTVPVSYGGTGTSTSTGSGSTVLSISPTFVTPILGTPASGTLTNCTGLTNAGLVNSSVTVGSTSIALGATASTVAGLTLTTPILGTPTSGTLTNCTGLPVSTGVSGFGTGVASALGVNIGANTGLFTLGGAINTTPKTFLDINANTSSSPALAVSTSLARFQSVDNTLGGMEWVSYGAGAGNVLAGVAGGGTAASPSATAAVINMFNLRGYGHNGTSFQIGGLITIHTSGTWSGTNQGTQIDLYTTPLNTTAVALAVSVLPSGGFSIGGGGNDPGIGGLYINNATMINTATAFTNGAGVGAGTLTNAPAAGNPTKWVKINDSGTIRYIPAW